MSNLAALKINFLHQKSFIFIQIFSYAEIYVRSPDSWGLRHRAIIWAPAVWARVPKCTLTTFFLERSSYEDASVKVLTRARFS